MIKKITFLYILKIFSESLFNPSIVKGGGVQLTSMLDLPRLVTNSVTMCDPDVRSSLYSNISIVGGNSYFLGLVERLYRELSQILPQAMCMKVHIPIRKFIISKTIAILYVL